MKYNDRHINNLYTKGRNNIRRIKYDMTAYGPNFNQDLSTSKDHPASMLSLIERLKGLTTEHIASQNKSRYQARFERERDSALEELWGMYRSIQGYINTGVFEDGGQSGMQAFTPRLEEHLIRSRSESPSCGTYYRSKEAHKRPITEGPLASVKGMECDVYGPRWESRRTYKLCSRVDGVTGGRSVMAIGSTGAYPKGTKFETYEVKMVSRNNRYMFPRDFGEWSYTVKRPVYKG